jgi:hypothetical protein
MIVFVGVVVALGSVVAEVESKGLAKGLTSAVLPLSSCDDKYGNRGNNVLQKVPFFHKKVPEGGNLRGVFLMLIEQRIAAIRGTSGIGFAVESKGLPSSAWRVGQPGDAF